MLRSTEDVIADLKKLIHTQSYIYSLCLILYEDFHLDINKIHEINHRAKLSVKECSLILGFLSQKEINFSTPASPEEAIALKDKTYELMRELHSSFMAPQLTKIQDMLERQKNGEVFEDDWAERLDFFVKDKGMMEPMFYAGDGVYDFQYLEYLEPKYKYDRDWLLENKGFDIDQTKEIINTIRQIHTTKTKNVTPFNLKDVFPKVAEKARKKLKKQLPKEKIDEIERQQFVAITFYQFKALFPTPEIMQDDNSEGWQEFYQNLLGLFTVSPSEFTTINQEAVRRFFQNFSFVPACNEGYEGPGFFNILNSRPIIDLADGRYFIPINYLMTEAIYESPFYWMFDDAKYRDKLAEHRGKVGEEIAYSFLSKVFGTDHTYRSVVIEKKKGHRDTDIDVLCILGNKALCVQVKSKKLTLNAKRGDFDQLSKDFNGAVQDAYNQGLVSRDALLNGGCRFFNETGKEIFLPEINEVYIMGLTTENYPSLVHQVHMMLVKEAQDPFPLFLSVFDLELLVHYLKDPYDFLYYVRQRIDLMDYFRADEELVYLGYHLDRKLWRMEGYDHGMIETDFGGIIDRNYYPHKTGMLHLLPEKDDPILNRWKDPYFDVLVKELKSAGHAKATDIVFHLLDWSGDARKDIVTKMISLKDTSRSQRILKSMTTSAAKFGLSYLVLNNTDPLELQERALTYATLRKYLSKSDTWLGMGSFSTSRNLIDTFIYLDEPWQTDMELEAEYKDELAKMKTSRVVPITGNHKIGRNDPCPCKSGKKYKKCCGMNL
ncbi:SEC-C domain-containing protein [Mucilaginibacter sp. BJC16-A38]|uniref:SEC-C metal-binding domain-containing protein n=1 Tax=Mucilaginibacter phenanthrenivorans TaxID=1234842 RepID=UPI0021579C33|nr:SEC-C metal-binding domain-containing protein [Mucilaginibacter phenanthrenivorans]MCR8559384.1 SEC-C domain-containing protein [Mucilaginibacter phenanthrenivorans]